MSASRSMPPYLALVAFLLPGANAAAAEYRIGQLVMGTVLQVTVVASDADVARSVAEECLREARRWDDILTTWRPEGELARLNRYAGQGPAEVSGDLASVLARMLQLSAETGGAFDPAVGAWLDRWRKRRAPPDAYSPVPRLSAVLQIAGNRVTVAPGVALDAGGIGKGVALDALGRLLRARGVAAFIDFGGSALSAVGSPPEDPSGWTVALSGLSAGELHGTLALRDASLSTSRATAPDDEVGPIIDPSTGAPVHAPRLALVLSPDATAADAWSTALVVLGRQGLDKAKQIGLAAMVEDGRGTTMTPALAEKVRPPTARSLENESQNRI
jgi:thiamine biosynthesis lipoprotein